jgi:hypothetical protein
MLLASFDESQARCGRGGGGDDACRALAKFIAVIEADQRERSPEIPSALASDWISTARAIESELGCGGVTIGHHRHDRDDGSGWDR